MQDPSQGIQAELRPHVHLVSTYRFPQLARLHPEKAAEWLQNAPKITRDQAPFYWTYLDRPADGTIFLLWQSLSTGGADYASDGFIWPPVEAAFQIDLANGHTLEIYHHKVGYSPGEGLATHARHRYRIRPSRQPQQPGPNPDPSLWVVHYTQAEPQDQCPSNLIPITGHVREILSVRQHLQAQGQIIKKEFMLHDRGNWPQILFPRGGAQPGSIYNRSAPVPPIPLNAVYNPHAFPTHPLQHQQQGPPAKRARPNPSANIGATGGQASVIDADDDEDTSRGDYYDQITPRDISAMRYKQNHEFMEEVISSPYQMKDITPADLGLGLLGQLAHLTNDLFDAPFKPDTDVTKHPFVAHLPPEKSDEFKKRIQEYITKQEMEMKVDALRHNRRMEKFKKGTLVAEAEQELRIAVHNPEDTGPEYWRLEGRITEEDTGATTFKPPKVADIVARVEASLGKRVQEFQELVRIQAGGYLESPNAPSPPPAQPTPAGSSAGSNDSHQLGGLDAGDMDMGNSAGGLLDQYHTGLSLTATPGSNNFPTPGFQGQSPAPAQQSALQSVAQANDVTMSGGGQDHQTATAESATGTPEWVVVPPGGITPENHTHTSTEDTPTADAGKEATTTAPTAITQPSPANPTSDVNTPSLPDFNNSPNDFGDLGDLNTAGDALAGYGDDGGLEDMMDDSAFGDAFHGVEPHTEREGEGDIM